MSLPTMKVSLWLKRTKVNAAGKAPISLRITLNEVRTEVTTGIRIEPDKWNARKSRIKETCEADQVNNATLELLEAKARLAPLQMEAKHLLITGPSVRAFLLAPPSKEPDILTTLEAQLTSYYAKHNLHTCYAFTQFVGYLRRWHGTGPLRPAEFDKAAAHRFARWLASELSSASARTALGAISAMLIRAGLFELNPFKGVKLTKSTTTERISLSQEQLQCLRDAELPRPKTRYARDIYMCQFYLQGSRLGVVLELQWKQFDGTRIRYRAEKSGPWKSVLVTPQLRAILERYRPATGRAEGLIFPVLPSNYFQLSREDAFKARRAATTKVWEGLRQAAKCLGLPEGLHSHTARHTMAFMTYEANNKDVRAAQQVIGHASLRQTEAYLRSMRTEETDSAAANVYDNI